MDDNSGSKDKALEALDFIINVLKEHEQALDESIHELAIVTEQKMDTSALNGKIGRLDEKVNILQKEVTALINLLLHAPTANQEPHAASFALPASVQSGRGMVLNCTQWEDFLSLAAHAETLTFSFEEQQKILRVDTTVGNQIITYTGAFPGYSAILKTWLSKQLDTPEQNIFEGTLGKPKLHF